MGAAAPTVIVTRRVKPGAERDFQRWNDRVLFAVKRFDGYLGSEVQSPDAAHPGEWVTVYRFTSAANLDAWLASPQRASLMREGEGLLEGPAREQRLVEPAAGATGAVTAVISQRVRSGAEDEFHNLHAEIVRRMRGFDGFLRSEVSEPVPGVQDDHVIVFSFRSRSDLDRWLTSDERREITSGLQPMLEGERTLNVVGGFGGWFAGGGDREPRRWKQAVAVLIALFPTSFTLRGLQRWLLPDAPWVPALIVTNLLVIVLLTWVLMPPITRWLGGWLRR